MLVFQARPALSADLPQPLPCLLFFRSARRPVYPVDAATQPHPEEPTGSFAACYKVSRRYAGDGSLHLERCSPQSGHGSLCFKRRSDGDGSLRLERRSSQPEHGNLRLKHRSAGDRSPRFQRHSPQLRHYSDDRNLRLGHRSSQPWHGSPRTAWQGGGEGHSR